MKRRIHIPRLLPVLTAVLIACCVQAQGGDQVLLAEAEALFEKGEYAKAHPMYSQLVSLSPRDHELNYKYGACILYGDDDKSKAIGYLKFATSGPATSNLAWYFLGRAYQLDYQFAEAISAYQHYRGTADKKLMARFPVDILEQQCRNGKFLLSNLKDIEVHNKLEVDAADFFRFYDLSDIGGKIVVTPSELLSSIDRRSGEAFLTYLPSNGGPIFFSSYGRDGKTGRDIYRTELLPTGSYATPVKLAGYINTDQDEDYAVMAPDGRSFYFSSKGHNSMGGYDVFRSSYDPGMDVFGPPENMDFAVNTPADERLYIVGPDGMQACFASDRDSKQGMLHVYRVGTTQTPINLTVLKGTYASAYDPADRRARIIVEDNLTRERVADVTTDINGAYVLALPRGGKYTVLVEGGPSGRTHLASMDVPSFPNPAAFRQEIELVERGGEQVDVRNYFDQPLDEDVMALALDDIRRRAKLNVTGERAIAQEPAPEPSDSPLQAAGFDGTVTMDQAMAMAVQEVEAAAALAEVQEQQQHSAFALALEHVAAAEAGIKQATALVKQAEGAADEAGKARLMREAAAVKQGSQEAVARARAAYQTGVEIGEAGALNRKRAAKAQAISAELVQAEQVKDASRTTAALQQLKAGIDERKGPDARPDEHERMRRLASSASAEAARSMRRATALREDETMLAERTARLERETVSAKGRKKEELSGQLATLQQQRSALHDEVETAFARAQQAEDSAALVRGQAALLKYLDASPDVRQAAEVQEEAIAGFVQRMEQVRAGNRALVIDPQYDPVSVASAEERERRIFDWSGGMDPLAGVFNSTPGTGTQTQVQEIPGTPAAATQAARTASGERPATAQNDQPRTGMPPAVADDLPDREGSANNEDTRTASMVAAPISTAGRDEAPERTAAAVAGSTQATTDSSTQAGLLAVGTDQQAVGEPTRTAEQPGQRATEPARDGSDRSAEQDGGLVQAEHRADGAGGSPGQDMRVPAEETAFLLANKLAELEQLRQGETDRLKKDSLDRAIADQQALITAFQAGVQPDADPAAAQRKAQGMHEYAFLDFDLTTLDEELVEQAYPGFKLRRQAILDGPATASEKASMLHALEMQLIDSIDVHTARLLATLGEHPDQADELLPRLERWNALKTAHVASAAQVLAAVDQEYVATETRALEDAQLSERAHVQSPVQAGAGFATPHNDAYIAISDDLEQVYASPLMPRAAKNTEAVALKDRDLSRAESMRAEIDSMQVVLGEMPAGKGYDKLRQRVDRKIDDLLIHQVDLGQRLAYIAKNELAVAQDSAKVLAKDLSRRGVAPSEPLWSMGVSYVEAADGAIAKAKSFRKQADNANDIFKRNSLYRQAYAEELKALRDYDRSHTVRNFLLSGQAVPGEVMTYAEVEQRMFPTAFARAADGNAGVPTPEPVPEVAEVPASVPVPTEPSPEPTAQQREASDVTAVAGTTPVDSVTERTAEAGQRTAPVEALVGGSSPRADSTLLSEYLASYYYLNPEERQTVIHGTEESIYFMMKGRAMQERAEAAHISTEAEGAMSLAGILRNEAAALRGSPQEPDRDSEQVQKLETRADALALRSDSLLKEAGQLIASASMNDAQAAALMQGMPAERSAEIMDLEQGRRRTEPVLARTRPSVDPPAASDTRPASAVASTELPIAQEDPAGTQEQALADTSAIAQEAPLTPSEVDPAAAPAVPADTIAQETPVVPETIAAVPTPREPSISPGPAAPVESSAPVAREGDRPERMAGIRTNMDRVTVPFDQPLARDVFQIAERAAPRETEIPMDVPMPTGVVYKVQVGAFRSELPLEAFSDMTPVTGEHAGNGLVRYTAGMFTTAAGASEAGARVRERGYRDAFVVAYLDGRRIPLREAMRAEQALLAAQTIPSRPAASDPAAPALPSGGAASAATTPASTSPATEAPVTALPQPAPGAPVLADYPGTAQEVLAAFSTTERNTAYYNDPDAAPAKQVEAVKGLFFTVQVGVYSKPTALDRLFNITPLNSELTATGKIRYTTGIYREEGQAAQRRNGTVALGVSDAFVTAYLNGQRIPVRDARALVAKFGAEVLVDPALVAP